MKTVTVVIERSAHSRRVPLSVNGRMIHVPVGKETEIPERYLGALDHSSARYRIVEPPARNILDGTVAEIEAAIKELPREDLVALLTAETEGKARKGVVAAIEQALS